jgi:hypothetical protein
MSDQEIKQALKAFNKARNGRVLNQRIAYCPRGKLIQLLKQLSVALRDVVSSSVGAGRRSAVNDLLAVDGLLVRVDLQEQSGKAARGQLYGTSGSGLREYQDMDSPAVETVSGTESAERGRNAQGGRPGAGRKQRSGKVVRFEDERIEQSRREDRDAVAGLQHQMNKIYRETHEREVPGITDNEEFQFI